MTRIAIVFLLAFILLAVTFPVLAQELPEVELDEEVGPEDLGINKPRVLPGEFLYYFKDGWRKVREFFTFNPIAKIELKQKFASERIIELKELVKRKAKPEIIEKATENYNQESEAIKNKVMELTQKAHENPQLNSFLDKFVHQETLHHRILQRLENQVPEEVLEKIKQERERHLERFGDVMLKLEEKEKISERLEKNIEEIGGSKYKNFKNLEILIELEKKVPEEAKTAIQKAQENALKRLQEDLEKMSPEDQERFKDYLEEISGKKDIHLEILENLKFEMGETPAVRKKIMEARERILEKVRERVKETGCPEIEEPAQDFCKTGRIIFERDEKGCIVSFKCLIPREVECETFISCEKGFVPYNTGERDAQGCPIKKCMEEEKPTVEEKPEICITLWNPVCGVDGKTYSNECFARVAGMETAHRGACKEAVRRK